MAGVFNNFLVWAFWTGEEQVSSLEIWVATIYVEVASDDYVETQSVSRLITGESKG